MSGNSIMTGYVGDQSPSRVSHSPPMTTYRPPKRSTTGRTAALYWFSASGSVTWTLSNSAYAGIEISLQSVSCARPSVAAATLAVWSVDGSPRTASSRRGKDGRDDRQDRRHHETGGHAHHGSGHDHLPGAGGHAGEERAGAEQSEIPLERALASRIGRRAYRRGAACRRRRGQDVDDPERLRGARVEVALERRNGD